MNVTTCECMWDKNVYLDEQMQCSNFTATLQQLLCFLSKCTHNRLPDAFNDYFIQRPTTYTTRNPEDLEVTYGRTNFGLLTVKNKAARLWNSIPLELKEKASQLNFRKHIATHYIHGY